MTHTIRIIFSGRVQGVFFRASAKERADELNLKGHARNLPNGDVELLVQGPSENIVKLEQHLLDAFLCHIAKKETLSADPLSQFEIKR